MSDPVVPSEAPDTSGAPIDPHLEALVTAALHAHARTVTPTPDPSALTERLMRFDRFMVLRRLGFATGAVVVILAGLLVFGASRRESEVRTADGAPTVAVGATPGSGTPGRTDPAASGATTDGTADASSDTTSDVSIPLPGEVGPDGSTSTTAASTPGAVTTSGVPGATPTTRPGSPTTTGPGGPPPTGPEPTGPNPTTGPTVPPTNGPTTGPPPTSPTTPPTTIDPKLPPTGPPSSWCTAHQVSTTMRSTVGSTGAVLVAELDFGFAPPTSSITVAGEPTSTDRLILTRSTRSDASGRWTWNIRWNASATPYDTELHFTITCAANGKSVPFTIKRIR